VAVRTLRKKGEREREMKKGWEYPGVVAHICNLSYSGGRDWEDHGSRQI
jgi:hypothetical protein